MGRDDRKRAARPLRGLSRVARGVVLAVILAASGILAFPASADITGPSAPVPSTTAAGVPGVTYTLSFTSTDAIASPEEIILNAPTGTFTDATFQVRNVTTNTLLSDSPTITNAGAT